MMPKGLLGIASALMLVNDHAFHYKLHVRLVGRRLGLSAGWGRGCLGRLRLRMGGQSQESCSQGDESIFPAAHNVGLSEGSVFRLVHITTKSLEHWWSADAKTWSARVVLSNHNRTGPIPRVAERYNPSIHAAKTLSSPYAGGADRTEHPELH